MTAGATYSLTYTYDYSGTYSLTYAGNVTSGTPLIPTNLDTTFLSTGTPAITHSPTSTIALFPFTSGYTAVAGAPTTTAGTTVCASEDPAAWPAGTSNGVALASGTRSAPAYAAGGSTATLGVAMGAATVKSTGPYYLTAVQTTPSGAGNPGCTTSVQYTFGKVLVNGTVTIALPYGSWQLYQSATSGLLGLPIVQANIATVTNAAPGGVGLTGVLTLDPRKGP